MTRRYLPALRGRFGDWAYYSCLMSLRELAERVSFATEIHKNKALSDMIQRELKKDRSADIAIYLKTNSERFFNSLVVAVYGGDPAWHELAEITPQSNDIDVRDVSEEAIASIGFLSFTGDEKLFALDGQHRLAGTKQAVQSESKLADDEASIIFVSHRNDATGLMRTRRLFTTLNKNAKPVTKAQTISLDEDDAMAIVARHLVENHPFFTDERVLFVANANLPAGNDTHLTTIVNLYDVLTILFTKVKVPPLKNLSKRPSDEDLERYRDFAIRYFTLLAASHSELKKYFASKKPNNVVKKYRHSDGGSVLFRPVGQMIFAHLLEAMAREHPLEEAMRRLGKVPTDLAGEPYVDLLWSPSTKTLDLRRQFLVRKVLLYMLGLTKGPRRITKLKADVAKARGVDAEDVTLPDLV